MGTRRIFSRVTYSGRESGPSLTSSTQAQLRDAMRGVPLQLLVCDAQ